MLYCVYILADQIIAKNIKTLRHFKISLFEHFFPFRFYNHIFDNIAISVLNIKLLLQVIFYLVKMTQT